MAKIAYMELAVITVLRREVVMNRRMLIFPALAAALAVWWPAQAATAEEDAPTCAAEKLRTAMVSTSLRVSQKDLDVAKAVSTDEIRIPRDWTHATSLLHDGPDAASRTAMQCLLGKEPAGRPFRPPTIQIQANAIVITSVQEVFLDESGSRLIVGLWAARLESGEWTFRLSPTESRAAGISQSWWASVELSAPEFAIDDVSPLPSRTLGKGSFQWKQDSRQIGPPTTSVTLRPGQRAALTSWLTSDWHWLLAAVIQAAADVLPYLLALLIALRLRRRPAADTTATAVTQAAGVLTVAIAVIISVHLLVLVALAMRWPTGERVPNITPEQWQNAAIIMVFILAVAAYAAWWSLLRHSLLRIILGGGLIAAAGVTWWTIAMVPRWTPESTAQRAYRLGFTLADWLAAASAIVTGILIFAALTGLALTLISHSGDHALSRVTRAWGLLIVTPVALLIALVQPIQYALFLRGEYRPIMWLSDQQVAIWPDLVDYPGRLLEQIVLQLWPLVIFGVLVVLRARAAAGGQALTTEDRVLTAFLFITGLVWWPNWYAGIFFPLAALAALGALLLFLRAARSYCVLAQIHRERPGAPGPPPLSLDKREHVIREYRDLEVEYRQLEQQPADGDNGPERQQQKLDIEEKLKTLRSCVRLPADQTYGPSPLDVALAYGPESTWWANGTRAARFAALFAIPAGGYMLWASWRDGAGWESFNGWFGPLQITAQIFGEAAFWIIASFVLGCLWRELPGRRGFLKPVIPVAAYAVGIGADQFLVRTLGQEPASGYLVRILALFLVLTAVAVLLDARALQPQRSPWAGRLSPLVRVYRLGTASSAFAAIVTQIAALIGLWLQLREGVEVTSPIEQNPTSDLPASTE